MFGNTDWITIFYPTIVYLAPPHVTSEADFEAFLIDPLGNFRANQYLKVVSV